jgi:hypothetical protein
MLEMPAMETCWNLFGSLIGFGVVAGFFVLIVSAAGGFTEFANTLAHGAENLGQLASAKNEKNNYQNEAEFEWTEGHGFASKIRIF